MPKPRGEGSVLRYGASLVAIGGPTQTTVADNSGTATLTFTITEPGFGGKLVLMADGATVQELAITSIKHNNDELINGSVPFDMFKHDSLCSPIFGHYFEVNDTLTVDLINSAADLQGDCKVLGAFNVLQ